MKQIKKYTAVVLFIVILLLPVLSSCYIMKNTNHLCKRTECPVCVELSLAKELLVSLRYILPGACFALLFIGCYFKLSLRIGRLFRMHTTLITLKVELLN